MANKPRGEWDAYLLGLDDAAERPLVHASVAASSDFSAFERATGEALALWSAERAPAAQAPVDDLARGKVWARLLSTLASEERFRPFFAELEGYFALATSAMREILRKLDDPASYQVAPMPGVCFFHFAPGASSRFAEAGMVKLAKGTRFPRHQHQGDEVNFVLEGTLIDNGEVFGPGSAVLHRAGSAHDYRAGQGRDLILAAGHNGITYLEDR